MKYYLVFVEDVIKFGNIVTKEIYETEEDAKSALLEEAFNFVRDDGGERQVIVAELKEKTLEQLATESAKTAPIGMYVQEDPENNIVNIYEKYTQVGWVRTTAAVRHIKVVGYSELELDFDNNFMSTPVFNSGIPQPPCPSKFKPQKKNKDDGPSFAFLDQMKQMFENHDQNDPSFKVSNIDTVAKFKLKKDNIKTNKIWLQKGLRWVQIELEEEEEKDQEKEQEIDSSDSESESESESDIVQIEPIHIGEIEIEDKLVQNNGDAQCNPTKYDDCTRGYGFGSIWKTQKNEWFCINSIEENAEWYKYSDIPKLPEVPTLEEKQVVEPYNYPVQTTEHVNFNENEIDNEDELTEKEQFDKWLDVMEKELNQNIQQSYENGTFDENVYYEPKQTTNKIELDESLSESSSDESISDNSMYSSDDSSDISDESSDISDDSINFSDDSDESDESSDISDDSSDGYFEYDNKVTNDTNTTNTYMEALNLEMYPGQTAIRYK